jgi:hypothetical protein
MKGVTSLPSVVRLPLGPSTNSVGFHAMRSASISGGPNGSRHGLSIALAALCSALAIAACGSSGKPRVTTGTGASSAYALRLRFSTCMRSHGVPNFPDPPANGDPFRLSSLDEQSPAFQSAQQSCKKPLRGSSQGSPLPESQKLAAITNAQCMRKHGVPSFPDPTFPSSGGSVIQLPAATNADSPAFKKAQKICGRP